MHGIEQIRAVGPSGFTRGEMEHQIRSRIAGRYWDEFGYSPTNPIVVPANGQANGSISILSTSTFLALAAMLTAVQDATPATFVDPAPLTVQIRSSSGDNYFSADTHVRNVMGSGERPCYWPFYRLQEASTTLTLQFTNLSATDLRVFPTLLGIRVYGEGALPG